MSTTPELVLYGIKTCDTCRKALKAFGPTARFHDFRVDGVDREMIAGWAAAVGWETLLNRKSTTWRSLPDTDKADLDEARALDLMTAHPTLIKRPVTVQGDTVRVG